MTEQRLTVEGLIEVLRETAAAYGSRGNLLPVVIEGPDGPLRYKVWLETGVREVHTDETGERHGTTYAALVIRASYD